MRSPTGATTTNEFVSDDGVEGKGTEPNERRLAGLQHCCFHLGHRNPSTVRHQQAGRYLCGVVDIAVEVNCANQRLNHITGSRFHHPSQAPSDHQLKVCIVDNARCLFRPETSAVTVDPDDKVCNGITEMLQRAKETMPRVRRSLE